MIILYDDKNIYNIPYTATRRLKKTINTLINDEKLEEIINIIYRNRNNPTNDVVGILCEHNYCFIQDEQIDLIIAWMKLLRNFEL